MMDATALKRALQAKFGPPGRTSKRRILKQLGLDEDLDAPAAFGGGNTDALKKMRVDIENLLGELDLDEKQVGKILALLDKHAPFDRLDDNDPNAERAREIAGDDTTQADLKKLRAFLMAGGLSEADSDAALDIVKSRALDNTVTGMPKSAPAGFGGALGLGMDSNPLDVIRGTATTDWAVRRDDLGILADGLERAKRRTASARVRIGMDSAETGGFAERHPEASRVF
jgi:hypothetical protein